MEWQPQMKMGQMTEIGHGDFVTVLFCFPYTFHRNQIKHSNPHAESIQLQLENSALHKTNKSQAGV